MKGRYLLFMLAISMLMSMILFVIAARADEGYWVTVFFLCFVSSMFGFYVVLRERERGKR